ncbi:glycosyltransferase [Aestuariimicrobium ganziense]|uniref:glycosyltransferase n=1 Tax=Aestuariimicrobium ganziense TaxID=2773677 RepID=UPI001F3360AD|nr:glycosyltransferase [Aestuariimicrobium ganziense]
MHTSPIEVPGSGDAGGMNVVERQTAEALADLGHTVDLVTRKSSPDDPDELEVHPGVTLRTVKAGPLTKLPKSEIDQHIDEFREGLRTLAPADVLHSHHWMSGVAALPVAEEWGVPHVQSYHSVAALPNSPLSAGEPPESPHRVAGERLTAQQSDVVVAISTAEAHTVIHRCGADPARVHIVAPGVDTEVFRRLQPGEEPWRPTDEPLPNGFILFTARLQPLKGPDLALRALAHVEKWRRPHLVIAGEASQDFADYTAELHDLVPRLGLDGQVTFTGALSRDELARALRSARLSLVPSHSETFGLIALESEASGTPVIASAAGGLREAVAHGETGQLMDSRRPEDWGRAITLLLEDETRLEHMGVVACIHARRFTWQRSARQLVDVYREVMEGHHR